MQLQRCLITAMIALGLSASLDASAIGSGAFSGATVINFDSLAGGACVGCGDSITNQYAGLGVVFNDPSYPGQVTANASIASVVFNDSLPNIAFVYQGGGSLGTSPLQILFSIPVTMVGFDFGSSLDSFLKLDAYDASHTLLESLDYEGSPTAGGGLGGFAGIQEASNIAELDVSYHPNFAPSEFFNFGIDNLEFPGAVAAPEPATLIPAGLGLLGIILVRRKNRCS